jgi:hypothetical protein
MESFQTLAKSMKMPPNFASLICDEALAKTFKLLQMARRQGKLTITDLFTMIGKETQAIMDEEVAIAKESVQQAVGKKAAKKGKAAAEPVHKQRGKGV